MEDTRRRNDASMARKRANAKAINPAAANSAANPESPLSPSSTGAMDSLLEKLRAAAPQARDQRDRRRRARLKDRHQTRVASGQTIPDMGDLTKNSSGDDEDVEKKLLDPSSAAADGADNLEPISEGEDIADRAATLLEGLRKDGGNENSENPSSSGRPSSRDSSGSLRIRRRRESADVERASRRRRRARESSSTGTTEDDATLASPPGTSDGPSSKAAVAADAIPEEADDEDVGHEEEEEEHTLLAADGDGDRSSYTKSPPLPQTVVSPPSPEPGDRREKPVVVDDD